MNQLTKRDLADKGLDALSGQPHGDIKLSAIAGGISFASALEVIEVAKLMAVSGHAVPKHLRLNPGACLRIVFQAVEWRMSPWGVADKSYEVNDRLAYESQLIHAVVEARAPLKERLNCAYEGEGPERRCLVSGMFNDGTVRQYLTPKFKDIRVKNSPLWKDDPDQQLWYYATRAWARKWCPDVLLGIYSKDELEAEPTLGRDDAAPGLHSRLIGSNVNREEGHKDGHASEEINADPDRAVSTTVRKRRSRKGHADDAPPHGPEEPTEAEIARSQDALGRLIWEGEAVIPLTNEDGELKEAKAYAVYCQRWLSAMSDPDAIDNRWAAERPLRNRCGLTEEDRKPLEALKEQRVKELAP